VRRWITAHRRAAWALGAVLVIVAASTTVATIRRDPGIASSMQRIAGVSEPGGGPVELDTTLYLPASTPAPAILLAHGFGGSKNDLAAQARSLAQRGYVVLAYSARGFGASGGLIHLDAPDFEIADASRLVDWLATRPEVALDAPGDPRIGVAGSSYGGGLALLLAGYDHRIDVVAADITWNELADALFPQSARGGATGSGVFKRLWAGYLFAAGADGPRDAVNRACGRFAADICDLYQRAAQTGALDDAARALLHASSPASVLSSITAPTLLSQGEQDSLFPLEQADANARGIAAGGAPVQVRWRAGGHDGGGSPSLSAIDDWFRTVLVDRVQPSTAQPFVFDRSGAGLSAATGRSVAQTIRVTGGYPGIAGLPGAPRRTIVLTGDAQTINAPAGGAPAAVTSVPALGGLLNAAGLLGGQTSALTDPPGQVAKFLSAPLSSSALVVGAAQIQLSVTSLGATWATLFVGLHDVSPDGASTLPAGLVAPVLLTGLQPGVARPVTIDLPAIVTQVASGDRLRISVATTDLSYLLPSAPAQYTIALVNGGELSVPTLSGDTLRSGSPWVWVGIGLAAIALAMLIAWAVPMILAGRARRRRTGDDSPSRTPATGRADDTVPLIVEDLVKEYRGGYRAVDGVSFRVERGQVVGLLGPNGAGKTTVLRMVMGLIRPTSGRILVFGQVIVPGAPVLSRLGAFVEGAGFLPHLSGRDNLRLFWAATGLASPEADVETALEIAGLGASVDRKVKTYSQGMRQRLAIAQAMLGLPEVLVLDEPTNGLDPPQIAEMRSVLRRYAATGRTVIVSSHLLSEVEQTCSHVVVMHRGRIVSAGAVEDIAGAGSMQLAVPDPAEALAVLSAAGIDATEVPARRALEEVFLQLIGGDDDQRS
jgi:ABC-2 type transport system ATP-binding protein